MIGKERIHCRKDYSIRDKEGDYVLYWMQAAQRVHYNHALDYACMRSRELQKPLVVYFGLTPDFPGANLRHYVFMLEGLEEGARSLEKKGIYFSLCLQSPPAGAIELADKAALLVMDSGYLDIQYRWRSEVTAAVSCPVVEVETNIIVPVETAAEKEQYSAAPLRRRIHKKLLPFTGYTAGDLEYEGKHYKPSEPFPHEISVKDIPDVLKNLEVDRSVFPSPFFRGGYENARNLLDRFLGSGVYHYDQLKNDPTKKMTSGLSPYLHFGQISPLEVYHEVQQVNAHYTGGFLEELVVRRELACNFTHYNADYYNLRCLPSWCLKTLEEHSTDKRPYHYSPEEFEEGTTHDPYWNAAQWEMRISGKMAGYMRMYWGKKVIEWTRTPDEAYEILSFLNDKYELDGRDPNGYAGIAWCFGKHDRPWQERPIFGKIRYMNQKGLKRKFPNIDEYVSEIEDWKKKYLS